MWIIKWSKREASGSLAVYFRSEFEVSKFLRDYATWRKDYELTIEEI